MNHLTNFAVFSTPWRPYLTDRYLTAVSISQTVWKTSDYAVLTRGDDFADALSAGVLAHKYGGPLLLTKPNEISKDTLNELKRLEVKHLFIVGGTVVVSQGIEDALKAIGITVERIYGTDRYETSVRVAEKLGHSSSVFLATGSDFPDALSASVIAANLGMPILLTNKGALPTSVVSYLQTNSVGQTYILGGTGVIDTAIEDHVPGPIRLAGYDRYETNIAILDYFAQSVNWEKVYITGKDFADGITGGVLAAQTSSPLMLTGDTLSPATLNYLKAKMISSSRVHVLGGEAAIPASVLAEITDINK
ncbi:MAG: hypothetical protein JL50_19460 [Peptococcaceae bacterium BICA1-7]|nr:MAG: hypothetical protein JL50_19460 [Peptococcaceae bacterium BICA1-7]